MSRERNILLFEADGCSARARAFGLRLRGYTVVDVGLGSGALKALAAGSFDLLLADYLPPVHIAEQFVSACRQIDPGLKICFFSARIPRYLHIEDADGFLAGGAAGMAPMLAKIEELVGRRRSAKKLPARELVLPAASTRYLAEAAK